MVLLKVVMVGIRIVQTTGKTFFIIGHVKCHLTAALIVWHIATTATAAIAAVIVDTRRDTGLVSGRVGLCRAVLEVLGVYHLMVRVAGVAAVTAAVAVIAEIGGRRGAVGGQRGG